MYTKTRYYVNSEDVFICEEMAEYLSSLSTHWKLHIGCIITNLKTEISYLVTGMAPICLELYVEKEESLDEERESS